MQFRHLCFAVFWVLIFSKFRPEKLQMWVLRETIRLILGKFWDCVYASLSRKELSAFFLMAVKFKRLLWEILGIENGN